MSHNFYIKHKRHAAEKELFMMTIKDEGLPNNLNRPWRHPLIKRFCHIAL